MTKSTVLGYFTFKPRCLRQFFVAFRQHGLIRIRCWCNFRGPRKTKESRCPVLKRWADHRTWLFSQLQRFDKPLLISWLSYAGLSLIAPFSGISVERLTYEFRWRCFLVSVLGVGAVVFFSLGLLYILIPLVGAIWLLVLFFTEGNQGENQYGPDPKTIE